MPVQTRRRLPEAPDGAHQRTATQLRSEKQQNGLVRRALGGARLQPLTWALERTASSRGMVVISMVQRPKMKFSETYEMKAESGLEKILDVRYIHGSVAYLEGRAETHICLPVTFVDTLSRGWGFSGLAVVLHVGNHFLGLRRALHPWAGSRAGSRHAWAWTCSLPP